MYLVLVVAVLRRRARWSSTLRRGDDRAGVRVDALERDRRPATDRHQHRAHQAARVRRQRVRRRRSAAHSSRSRIGRATVTSFNVLIGIVWLAIVVTWGVRSVVGALMAGVLVTVLPQQLNLLLVMILLFTALGVLARLVMSREIFKWWGAILAVAIAVIAVVRDQGTHRRRDRQGTVGRRPDAALRPRCGRARPTAAGRHLRRREPASGSAACSARRSAAANPVEVPA